MSRALPVAAIVTAATMMVAIVTTPSKQADQETLLSDICSRALQVNAQGLERDYIRRQASQAGDRRGLRCRPVSGSRAKPAYGLSENHAIPASRMPRRKFLRAAA